ncbi:TPA: hypothetical protein ACF2DE_000339 [Clostridium perfringens]
MFNVSKEFNQEINKLQDREFNAKVIIRDKEFSGSLIYEMSLEESVNPSDNFSIGTVCSNTFEIKLINTGDIFDNAIIKPYVGLYIGEDIEYVPLGVFNVIKTSVKGKFINLECVDNMLCLEKVYFSDLSYPADINDIAKEICKKAGVNFASKLPNYRVNKIEGYSLREAIGIVASLCGSFARFNRIGDLEIKGYEFVNQELEPNNIFKLDIEADECFITKVIAKRGEDELSKGSDEGISIVFNNPVITKEILDEIYQRYRSFRYIPYSLKWKGNPAIMAGDILNLTDLKGNKYNALVMEQKFTYKNGISSEVKAKGKGKRESSFDSKGSVTQSMERYSIEQANIKKALIDKASINDLTAVDAKIQRLYTEDLTAIRADIVNLNSKKANIVELNAVRADLQQAIIGKANITDLQAAVGKIGILESKTASIENALNKNLTAENIATGAITAGSGIIANGAIGDAEINSLSGNKLKFGTVDTSLVTIAGPNGRLRLQGNKLQIFDNKDGKLYERIMLGVDSNNNSSLILRGADGRTILLDQNGLTKAGITEGFGKIDDNSIDASLIFDKNSMVRSINGATETIRGTKVQIGDRTLDVELGIQSNTIIEQGKVLDSQKATIIALQDAIKLKVDNQTFTSATQTINRNILGAKEEAINTASKNTTNAINNIEIGGRNLLIGFSEYTENNKYKIIANRDDNYISIPSATVNLIAGEKYTFSIETDCINWGSTGDSVEAYLLLDNAYTHIISIRAKIYTFTPTVTGEYTLRLDVNKNGTTHYFWNVKIEKGQFDTGWSPAPEDVKKYSDEVAKAKADLAQANAIANADGKITEEERKRIQQAQENLNTAIARADKAKADAKAYSDTLGQQLKANAEKYANDVAIAKAELAKQQSKAYADGVVTEEEKKRIKQAEDNLNTAIAKANEAENKAREYADAKKIEAINKASADAALKAAEALNSAKAFTTAEISTTNSNLHKVTSEINILKDKIESKVGTADVEKAIQNIKFGGRNLLLNTGLFNDFSHWNFPSGISRGVNKDESLGNDCHYIYYDLSGNSIDRWWAATPNPVPCVAGEKVSAQAMVFVPANDNRLDNTVNVCCLEIQYFNDRNERIGLSSGETINSNFKKDKWVRVVCENKTVPSGAVKFNARVWARRNARIWIGKLKLENGTKCSDWTQAPEDTDQLIVESQNVVTEKIKVVESNLTQTKNSIEASVRDLDSQTKAITTNVTNINNDLINKINIAKGDAINKAKLDAKDYTNAQISTVNTKVHNVESNLNILKNKIESKVGQSDIDKSISAIKIGGRNLVQQSIPKEYTGFSGRDNDCQFNYEVLLDTLNVGDTITVSFLFSYENLILASNTGYGFRIQGSGDVVGWSDGAFPSFTFTNKIQFGSGKSGSFRVEYNYVLTSNSKKNTKWYPNIRTDKIRSGKMAIKEFMVEFGTKRTAYVPAPEDTDKLVVDSIKVVDTKISDVSSKITQLKDSVTIDINSINSKTHTIETNLVGKASKQEVTEVNNRVATIKANLDSITQRVSSTESKTHTLETNVNGKASKQELTVVNNKVTEVTANLNGITQRVGNTESRINTLDGKVANAVTMQQFTEFKQSNNKFVMDLASSGGYNLVKNSAFESQDWRNWSKWGSIIDPVVWMNNEQSGHKWACKITTTGQNQGIQQQITGLEFGKVYTVTMKVWSENGVIGAAVRNAGVWNGNHFGGAARTWGEVTFTFEAKEITTWLYIGTANTKCTPGVYWVTGIQITQGNCKQPWSQHPNENYNTNFTFDNEGLVAKFIDNSYTKMGHKGFEWFDSNNMSHAYHCLMEVGMFNLKQYGNGNWTSIKIQLPAYFRNKYFKAIAFPAGYSTGQTNLDTLTIQVQSYDIANATFTIQAFAHSQNGEYQNNINIAWMATA